MRIILSNILAIYRRELQTYFASPFAYAIAAIFWLLSGFFFVIILLGPDGLLVQIGQRDQAGITEPPIDVPYQFLSIFLNLLGSLALFLLPMLSMGLYSEERKRGTLELLATSPVTNWAVAVGKLLGVLTFFITIMLPIVGLEAIAFSASNPPASFNVLLLGTFFITIMLPIVGLEAIAFSASNPPASFNVLLLGHLGLILMAAAVLSLGMFISSLTDSTILAAILTFALMMLLWITDLIASGIGGSLGEAIGHLSLIKHYSDLSRGVFNSSSIVLFASYVFLGLFLTAQSVEAFRFQRS